MRGLVYCTASFSICSLQRAKFPIIYPDFRLDYKVATLPLGLRSGDVAHLRLKDTNWNSGTLQVMGKGRYQVCLPLPQDVGDALLRYLECRPNIDTNHVFIRSIALSVLKLHGSL